MTSTRRLLLHTRDCSPLFKEEIKNLVCNTRRIAWSRIVHHRFNKRIRGGIYTLLLISKRPNTVWSTVPRDLLFYIISFFANTESVYEQFGNDIWDPSIYGMYSWLSKDKYSDTPSENSTSNEVIKRCKRKLTSYM